ncbi:hypothetical protein HBH69_000770 [Parastagonospora nodorum]|nr:hypothetical protein HBH51_125530 [Parastagonospora nodorum]KAH3990508.1 hypothetical protein HBH52_010370 [Parastagonospora nodorum]KAH4007038.1 hypothetical protein HBI10_020790 [Parastagonospora nodorum]KAH4008551.1 hypothetical protein HBI13_235280 [Parastagonospora nodorum]KAH4120757.1 hypothetical protein HBH47_104370 [Parastagonospora nodorum]
MITRHEYVKALSMRRASVLPAARALPYQVQTDKKRPYEIPSLDNISVLIAFDFFICISTHRELQNKSDFLEIRKLCVEKVVVEFAPGFLAWFLRPVCS